MAAMRAPRTTIRGPEPAGCSPGEWIWLSLPGKRGKIQVYASAEIFPDAVAVLSHLFLGMDALPPPRGSCGVDPTPDSLTCAAFDCS